MTKRQEQIATAIIAITWIAGGGYVIMVLARALLN